MRRMHAFSDLKMTDELEAAILDFVMNSSSDRVRFVANKIVSSKPATLSSIITLARTPAGRKRLGSMLEAIESSNVSLREAAGILQGALLAKTQLAEATQIDLIWTGPSTSLVPTRRTEPSLIQIINSAESKLFITSFVAYAFPSVLEALSNALTRNVEVSILLESSEAYGGGITFDVIGKMKEALPEALVYSWSQKDDNHLGGKVHAKVAVADGKQCFISSANLTTHAMELNMEAGVVISGGQVPAKLHRHLNALVMTRVIKLVRN